MNWKLVIVLALLACLAVAQRGGGSGGGSRSSSSRRSSHHRSRSSQEIAACKFQCDSSSAGDPAKLKACHEACDPSFSWKTFGIFGTIFAGIAAFFNKAQQKKRQGIIERFRAEHKEGLKDYQSNTEELTTTLNELINHDWHFIVFQTVNSYESKPFKMTLVESESDKYWKKVLISSGDQLGNWKGEGFISFGKDGIRFWMIKDYDDKKKAEQTGKWTYLTFSGQERRGVIAGDWEFEGFKGDQEYSGMFRLMQVKKE